MSISIVETFRCFPSWDVKESEEIYRHLVAEAEELGRERAEAYCQYRLSRTLIHRNELDEANFWLNKAENQAKKWREFFLDAHVLYGRAHYSFKSGEVDKAYLVAKQAQASYKKLHAQVELSEVTQFLAKLESYTHPN